MSEVKSNKFHRQCECFCLSFRGKQGQVWLQINLNVKFYHLYYNIAEHLTAHYKLILFCAV